MSGDCTLTAKHEHLDTAIRNMGNRYLTTMLIAKRIRQLHHGAPTHVEQQEGESLFSVVVHEIAEGTVTLKEPTDTSEAGDDQTTPEPSPTVNDDPKT